MSSAQWGAHVRETARKACSAVRNGTQRAEKAVAHTYARARLQGARMARRVIPAQQLAPERGPSARPA
jgi:hypothetical protein